ncbi:MAG: transglutaminase family protein [Jatrophihabitantaceae bacterium]
MSAPDRHVDTHLVVRIHQPLRVILQVAVTGYDRATVDERLSATCDGTPVAVEEQPLPDGNRVHLITPGRGQLVIDYAATVRGATAAPLVSPADRIVYLRPSRYAESDRIEAVAQSEFGGITGAADLLTAISAWAGSRLAYVPGSTGASDGAIDTLLARRGVCRDYAHLVIALLRAMDVPARFAAVYAPGLTPMDFHAVVEAAVGDVWRVVDATLLAPRASLVRIATGRDAADASFLSTYGGAADLLAYQVTAVIDGRLPTDDVSKPVSLS